jgi:hypothetical protein
MGRAHDPLMSFWPGKRRWLERSQEDLRLGGVGFNPDLRARYRRHRQPLRHRARGGRGEDFISSETIIGNGTWIDDEGVPNYFIR